MIYKVGKQLMWLVSLFNFHHFVNLNQIIRYIINPCPNCIISMETFEGDIGSVKKFENDLDELIYRLRAFDSRQVNYLLVLMVRMIILGYGQEFVDFLFRIVDSDNIIEFEITQFNSDEVLDEFDEALKTGDKIKLVSKVGNKSFKNWASEYFTSGRDLNMIIILVRYLIEVNQCINVIESVEDKRITF